MWFAPAGQAPQVRLLTLPSAPVQGGFLIVTALTTSLGRELASSSRPRDILCHWRCLDSGFSQPVARTEAPRPSFRHCSSSLPRAMQVAIIGAGHVGSTLGKRLLQKGHQVKYGSRWAWLLHWLFCWHHQVPQLCGAACCPATPPPPSLPPAQKPGQKPSVAAHAERAACRQRRLGA